MYSHPPEITYQILLNADIPTITKYCSTSKDAGKICNDDRFWREKFVADKILVPVSAKPAKYSWREFYLRLYYKEIRDIQILHLKRAPPKHIWITKSETYGELFATIKSLLIEMQLGSAVLYGKNESSEIVVSLRTGQGYDCITDKPLTSPSIPQTPGKVLDFDEVPKVVYSLSSSFNMSCMYKTFYPFNIWNDLDYIVFFEY